MSVLIIDDEADVRRVATVGLGDVGGMRVFEASGGAEGLRKAEEHAPDVILLDMKMPGMDGASTFYALRANPKTAAIPVLLFTTQPRADLGANGVVLKPFNPMTLAADVRAALRQ